ncbi:MAG: ABC transporter permease [Actinomycetota bacterium]|nr:ABC transporter permease [Actinomycetota bacterium]
MTESTTARPGVAPASRLDAPGVVSLRTAFGALVRRDLNVLDKNLTEFLISTVVQPLLLIFVLTWLFPTIGQGVGGDPGAEARFSTLVSAGVVAQTIFFQAIWRVGLPLVRELDVTNELEDRTSAPVPVSLIAVEKVFFGATLALLSALIVFPIAAFVPATPVYLRADWPVLLTVAPLACLSASALGLTVGTLFRPRSLTYLSSAITLPLAFLGAIFYTWDSLGPVPWLKAAVLLNPLVYMSEGLRAALVTGVPHMPLVAIYAALAGSAVALTALGTNRFRRRVML